MGVNCVSVRPCLAENIQVQSSVCLLLRVYQYLSQKVSGYTLLQDEFSLIMQ